MMVGESNQDYPITQEGATTSFAEHHNNMQLTIDNKPINSGPIAYLSKYQGRHHNIPVTSSIHTTNLKLDRNDSATNYGLASNRQVTPLIQPQGEAAVLNQSLGTINNDSKLRKMPH